MESYAIRYSFTLMGKMTVVGHDDSGKWFYVFFVCNHCHWVETFYSLNLYDYKKSYLLIVIYWVFSTTLTTTFPFRWKIPNMGVLSLKLRPWHCFTFLFQCQFLFLPPTKISSILTMPFSWISLDYRTFSYPVHQKSSGFSGNM